MAEVLSQSQIDALMKEMRNNGNQENDLSRKKEEKKYRKYDFYSPKKITKDKIKMLKGVYDNYARIASSRLNGVLRVSSEIEVIAVEEQRFYEFSNALSDNDILMSQVFKLPNNSKMPPALVHINPVPMLAMIDRMLGGDGEDNSNISSNYSYTDIEIELYKKIMGYFLDFKKDAWGNYVQLESEKIALEENLSLFQEISLDETVAIVILEIRIGKVKGKITTCIPRTLLTEVFQIIESKKHIMDTQEPEPENNKDILLSKIQNSSMTVKAEMRKVNVQMKDIYDMKVGDVIDLNQPQDSEILLSVGGTAWMKGKLGTYKKDMAVLIEGRIETQDERDVKDSMRAPVG